MGFPRQEYWGGLPFPPAGDLPAQPRDRTLVSCITYCIAGGFLTAEPNPRGATSHRVRGATPREARGATPRGDRGATPYGDRGARHTGSEVPRHTGTGAPCHTGTEVPCHTGIVQPGHRQEGSQSRTFCTTRLLPVALLGPN